MKEAVTMHTIASIRTISEEPADSSEEVLTSVQAQTAIAEQVNQMANQLYLMANKLVSTISKFQV